MFIISHPIENAQEATLWYWRPVTFVMYHFAGNFISTTYNLSGGYIPSFQKREVGSVGQRIQLAPIGGPHARECPDCSCGGKSDNPRM